MISDIIVPLQPEPSRPSWASEGYALSLASIFGAHVTAIVPSYAHVLAVTPMAEIPAELIREIQLRSDTTARSTLEAFEARADRAGLQHQGSVERGGPAEFADLVAVRARTFDLAVVPQPQEDSYWERELVQAVLFDSGRPTLVVPYIQKGEARLERTLVAWDGSKQAARAVHDALPLIRRAKSVEILTIYTETSRADDVVPGADLATHLARHGLDVTASSLDGTEIGVSNTLLSHVADASIDLIVMGGYAHSRLRHLVFGGATSGILEAMTVPVLMAH